MSQFTMLPHDGSIPPSAKFMDWDMRDKWDQADLVHWGLGQPLKDTEWHSETWSRYLQNSECVCTRGTKILVEGRREHLHSEFGLLDPRIIFSLGGCEKYPKNVKCDFLGIIQRVSHMSQTHGWRAISILWTHGLRTSNGLRIEFASANDGRATT